MAVISTEEVKKIAKLSRLKITDEQAVKFSEQLNSILEYAAKINELNTDNIEPTSHSVKLSNVLREDIVTPSFDRNVIIANAPLAENGFYRVPKIIE